MTYWVSCIVQEKPGTKPWLCACSEGCMSRSEAMSLAERYAHTFRCLSVWIDAHGVGGTETIFHKALVDSLGNEVPWEKG